MRCISTPNLNYLNALEQLWSVVITLGGIKEFTALKSIPNLKYLELRQVTKLSDLSFISDLVPLQNLFIEGLRNVEELPDLDKLQKLRRIFLDNLKGLKKLDAVRTAPSLIEFIFIVALNQEPENLLPVLENKNVKSVFCGFGNDKKNDHFKGLAEKFGKGPSNFQEFLYQ